MFARLRISLSFYRQRRYASFVFINGGGSFLINTSWVSPLKKNEKKYFISFVYLCATITFSNMNYFLVKTEPETYSWQQFVKDGGTRWDGVRNYAARKHLRSMKVGDKILFYHSGGDKYVVGISRVSKEAYQDPGTKDDWSAVDLVPETALTKPVLLSEIKAEKKLQQIYLVRQGRLSVMPLEKEEFELIVKMGI
jgi:predicted RNA-binding protein with PUA-like domain